MANVTFSSPVMARDVTVYAVAGDRGTILAIAKANKIPIPFDCQDGECGSCLIEVKKEMLKQLGKITKAEIVNAEVNDMPPRHRLACQCFVRDEDIMVVFEGDKTLPKAGPHVTHAARRFRGGMEIATVPDLLGYVARVEDDAAAHFDDLAKAMAASANGDVGTLFRQLADQSRRQAAEAKSKAGPIDAAKEVPADYLWPHYITPDSTALWAGDASLSRLDGLRAALQGGSSNSTARRRRRQSLPMSRKRQRRSSRPRGNASRSSRPGSRERNGRHSRQSPTPCPDRAKRRPSVASAAAFDVQDNG